MQNFLFSWLAGKLIDVQVKTSLPSIAEVLTVDCQGSVTLQNRLPVSTMISISRCFFYCRHLHVNVEGDRWFLYLISIQVFARHVDVLQAY